MPRKSKESQSASFSDYLVMFRFFFASASSIFHAFVSFKHLFYQRNSAIGVDFFAALLYIAIVSLAECRFCFCSG